jgi:hypothetical protein
VTAAPARAQEDASDAPRFELADQPAAVGPTDEFPLRLRVSPRNLAGLDVRVTLYDDINTRSGFEQTVAGEGLGDDIDTAQVSLDGAPTRNGVVTARFGMPDSFVATQAQISPRSAGAGVYPLEVELLADGTVVDHFVTWLVYLPGGDSSVSEPLSVVWVWSVIAPPARQADGVKPEPDVLADMLPGGRLERIASLLTRADDVPLTLDVSPETLQSWLEFAKDRDRLSDGANAVRVAAGSQRNQLLPAPYVPIDIPAFDAAGFGDRLSSELVAGAETMERLTDVRLEDTRTFYVDPVDDRTLSRLQNVLADQVLVREERLPPQRSNLTPARPFRLDTAGGASFSAASTNPTVQAWLDGPEPAALRAQRFLAGLSLIALEQPNRARGIVVATPRNWTPDVPAAAHVLRGLSSDALLDPTTLNDYFTRVPLDTATDDDETPLVRQLLPADAGPYPITTTEYNHARRALDAFRGVVGDDPSVARGERALLVALSSAFTRERALEELAVIDHGAASFLGRISITEQRVTLTARRAEIPLTFTNGTVQPVRVRVALSAPSGKALFPDGAEQVVTLKPGNQTQRFLVEARATGTFAMTVTLSSEDGQLRIGAPTEITVRSTVFSGWGAMLTVGAAVFLAGWWANHIWRSRRALRRAAV